jgi:hypothetical protein
MSCVIQLAVLLCQEGTVIVWTVGVGCPSIQLYKLRLDSEQYDSSWVLSVFPGPVLQQQGRHRRLLGVTVGGRLGAIVIWAVPMDSSSDTMGMGDDHVLSMEPYAQRIGGSGGDGIGDSKGGKGGMVWGAFVELPRDTSLSIPQQQEQEQQEQEQEVETEQQLPAVVTASTSKNLSVWRIRAAPSVGCTRGSSGVSSGGLEMVGLFPASGSFGSPDGIGGQGDIIKMVASEEQNAQEPERWQDNEAITRATMKTAQATSHVGLATSLARLTIGDQGGLLYTLALEISSETS